MAQRREPEKLALSRRMQGLFGARLQQLRRSSPLRVSQDELAIALGVSRTSVSNIERGRHRVFLDQVYSAARALGVGIDELLPSLADVFPEAGLLTAPHARVTRQSVREVTELTRQIQARVSHQLETSDIRPTKRVKTRSN